MIGPMCDDLACADVTVGEARRLGLALLEHSGDERGITVDVGPDLQYGDAPIATGQRNQLGLRCDDRLIDGAPADPLEGKDLANLFGERGYGVLVKQDFFRHGHVSLVTIGSGYPTAECPRRRASGAARRPRA